MNRKALAARSQSGDVLSNVFVRTVARRFGRKSLQLQGVLGRDFRGEFTAASLKSGAGLKWLS